MSDSEDDFMSDKFLIDLAPSGSSSTSSSSKSKAQEAKSYTERRNLQALRSMRKGQANNKIPLKQLEEQRRREGLNTSLFEQHLSSSSVDGGATSPSSAGSAHGSRSGTKGGSNKAMEMMMKMGWKAGEGLGKKRSPPPEIPSKRARLDNDSVRARVAEDEPGPSRGGIGSAAPKSISKMSFVPGLTDTEGTNQAGTTSSSSGSSKPSKASGVSGRIEPIRISMWSGRKGLSAREPSPPPLTSSNRDPDALDPEKLKRLGRETEGFRERQRAEFSVRERERKGRAAREKLVALDTENGVKFHPLHILPFDPLSTIPRPLMRLLYPAQAFSPSPSPPPSAAREPILAYKDGSNLSAAEKMREQIRRDMLSDLHGPDEDEDDEGGVVRFGILPDKDDQKREAIKDATVTGRDDTAGVIWDEMVSGAKRVLAMDPEAYLNFVVDQLRHEYLFCFWCAYRYKSYDEMEGPGGCPGEEEDDH
ncbi:hypothetical protein I316_07465 [Kwoniella heveanensis BCC8398]|uniref:G-patch domain-containing protein n=1 Tax=Kwoniella heveanensis BCC8398 TaxID=1296120 RepID=A0A1B9GIV4_9TREE|nr:hypothetical protein I316_07465 [Kwoniella heveanensis BCC8398]